MTTVRPAVFTCALTMASALSCAPSNGSSILHPEACADCHPRHVEQWSGSMHAYAGEDPVFRAMNELGQRETDGELGDLCVRCHAPLALQQGLTTDGTNLDEVPQHLRGVTCAVCHRVDDLTGTHNGAISIARDAIMRGGLIEPVQTRAHDSEYSTLHDRNERASSDMCIACHDVVLPTGFALERTGLEWQQSIFSAPGPGRQACGHCHMRGSDGPASVLNTPDRRVHDHSMAAIDVALTDFPGIEAQRTAIRVELDRTVLAQLCVVPIVGGSQIQVQLENSGAGHRFPSGAAHDRRVWVELIGYKDGEEVFERGVVADGDALGAPEDTWTLHDVAYDEAGERTHRFWEVGSVDVQTLPVATTLDKTHPDYVHAVGRTWELWGTAPDRVTMRIRLRPIGYDVLDMLIDEAELDPAIRDAMPTFEVRTLEWTGRLGTCVQ